MQSNVHSNYNIKTQKSEKSVNNKPQTQNASNSCLIPTPNTNTPEFKTHKTNQKFEITKPKFQKPATKIAKIPKEKPKYHKSHKMQETAIPKASKLQEISKTQKPQNQEKHKKSRKIIQDDQNQANLIEFN